MSTLARKDALTATASCCGYVGTLAAIELHSCQIQEQGGRCEDYPCCGHTDGDGCQTLPSHTADFYYRNPQFLHEPGSPEWFDAMDEYGDGEDDAICEDCGGWISECGGHDDDGEDPDLYGEEDGLECIKCGGTIMVDCTCE